MNMYQNDLLAVQNCINMNLAKVKSMINDQGYIMIKHPNQVFFVRPREGWEICNDPPGNPKNFWLTEKEIEQSLNYVKMTA